MKLRTLLLTLLISTPVLATTLKIENAWVREPAPGQMVVGGFMQMTSASQASLVGVSSPVAGLVELHEMKMDKGVMLMRPLKQIDLPKGQVVKLEPGGLHLMLENLKRPLKAGDKVPLTLKIKTNSKTEIVQTSAVVRGMGMTAQAAKPAPVATAATIAAKPVAAESPIVTAIGEKTYQSACMACHASGVARAPKTGDKAAWASRLNAGGMEGLYTTAIKGKGAMPAKGGRAALTDADVKAAVDYMVAKSK